MHVTDAVDYVAKRFVYKEDPKSWWPDYWFVMKEKDGKMYGDCDDFAVTVLWLVCKRNLLKFFWHVLFTHKHKVYRVRSNNSSTYNHLIGRVDDYWFDNWTLKALDKETFFKKTGHKMPEKAWVFGFIYHLIFGYFKR